MCFTLNQCLDIDIDFVIMTASYCFNTYTYYSLIPDLWRFSLKLSGITRTFWRPCPSWQLSILGTPSATAAADSRSPQFTLKTSVSVWPGMCQTDAEFIFKNYFPVQSDPEIVKAQCMTRKPGQFCPRRFFLVQNGQSTAKSATLNGSPGLELHGGMASLLPWSWPWCPFKSSP